MAMVVQHNAAAQLALGELNKNISKVGNLLAKVSSGQKINSAKDDSAQFAISELMRVKIRALTQAVQNVQNGATMIKTALEGIQNQINIMRTIREKVIDANNDTNTDTDRQVMQKEIHQFYKQIDSTAYDTDYNGQKLLIGNTKFNSRIVEEWDENVHYHAGKRVTAWKENLTDGGKAKMVEGSDSLNLIKDSIVDPDLEYLADGRPYVENGGPFDTFTKITESTIETLESFGNIKPGSINYMVGGSDGDNKIIKMDLSSYNSPSDLDGLAFTVTNSNGYQTQYVLSTNTSQNYAKTDIGTINIPVSAQSAYESSFPTAPIELVPSSSQYAVTNVININGCTSWTDVADKIKSSIGASYFEVTADDSYIEFTTKNPNGLTASKMNTTSITGFSAKGGTISMKPETNPLTYTHLNATKNITTSTLSVTLSGGKNKGLEAENPSPGSKAKGSVSISASNNVYYINGQLIKFVSGSGNTTTQVSITDSPFNVGQSDMQKGTLPRTLVDSTVSIREIGINSSYSWSDYSYKYTVNNGKLDVEALYVGTSYNGTQAVGSSSYTLYFQYKTNEDVQAGSETYESTFAAQTSVEQTATDGTFSHYDIDLTKYVGNRSTDTLEKAINELKNINFYLSDDKTYSFIDSTILKDLTSPSNYKIDLNQLRTSVKKGNDIATAIQDLLTSSITSKTVDGKTPRVQKISNGIRACW